MGNKWTTELGQSFLNTLAMPAEIATGQNFYDPTFTSGIGKGINATQDVMTDVGGALAPMAANALLPGAGTALTAARGVAGDLGTAGTQLPEHQRKWEGQVGAAGQGLAAMAPGVMGMMMEQGGFFEQGGGFAQTGPDLNAFNLPSHAEGGGQLNPNVEIEKQETVDPKAEYVYSDLLVNAKTNNTYAKDSEKYKGSDRDDDITRRTNEYGRANLRESQEALKKANYEKDIKKDIKKFEKKYGGYLKEQMAQGGYYTPGEAAAAGHRLTSQGSQYGGSGAYGGGKTQYANGGPYATGQGPNAAGSGIPGLDINDPRHGFNPNSTVDMNIPNAMDFSSGSDVPMGLQPNNVSWNPTPFDPNQSLVPQNDPNYGINQPNFNTGGAPGTSDPRSPFFNTSVQNPAFARKDLGQRGNGFYNDTPVESSVNPQQVEGQGFDWANAANQVGEFANIGYNIKRGFEPVDHYKSVGNPEYANAIALAESRNYNIDQAQKDVRRTFEDTRGAIAEGASGEGAYLGNLQGAQLRANRATQGLYDKKENMDNQYRMEEANVRRTLGSEEMARLNNEEANRLRGNAAQENMLDAATQGMSNMAQRNQKGKNQSEQDQRLLAMYEHQYGKYGEIKQDIDAFKTKEKRSKRGKKNKK